MPVFWLLAVLMTAVALAFVLLPLLRGKARKGPSAAEANLEVLRGQRRELEADVASGTLAAEARDQALAELIERAGTDLDAAKSPAAVASSGKPWVTAAFVALAIPAVAFGLYAAIGLPSATNPAVTAAAPVMEEQKHVIEMVDRLAAKVRERPDDARGWSLYARSTASLGRFQESADAYEHLLTLVPADAQVLADYADVLGMVQGRNLAGRPYDLARKALEIDPDHRKALALAGTAALDEGDYAKSAAYWQRLAAQAAPGSEEAREVGAILEEVRARAAGAGKPLPANIAAAPKASSAKGAPAAQMTAATPAIATGKSVSGVITIAPEVAARVKTGDTIFVLARAEGGPRAPLAVLRGTAGEMPMHFALDDSMAMSPQWSLSQAGDVRIEARISKSGNAALQPGDVFGTSAVVKPGAKDVRVVLDKVQQ